MDIILAQLTDIHIRYEDELEIINQRAIAIANALKSIIYDEDSILCICITGDIAFSGKEFQYIIAELFLDTIKSIIEKALNRVIFNLILVPGNHDCDFDNNDSIRELLLERGSLSSTRNKMNDDKVLKSCLSLQSNYFAFVDNCKKMFNTFANTNHSLVSEHVINISTGSNHKIKFQCINTSATSQVKEQKGDLLFYKAANIDEQLIECEKPDAIITLMHHDVHWFEWESKKDLTEYCQLTSDIIMAGHDHNEDYFLKTNYDESTNCIIKGNVLYESSKQSESGFNVLRLTLDEATQNFYSFVLNDQGVYNKFNETGTIPLIRNRYCSSNRLLSAEFLERLLDLEVDITCKNRQKLYLSDIFSYPTLVYSDNEKLNYYREKDEIIVNAP